MRILGKSVPLAGIMVGAAFVVAAATSPAVAQDQSTARTSRTPSCNYNVTSILYDTDNNNTPFQFQSTASDRIPRTPAGGMTL
jgi:hypothetical protein